MLNDIRNARQSLRREPLFAAAVLATLGIRTCFDVIGTVAASKATRISPALTLKSEQEGCLMSRTWTTGVIACAWIACAQPAEIKPQPAVSYLVQAFKRCPLVVVSEMGGSRETMELMKALIRAPVSPLLNFAPWTDHDPERLPSFSRLCL